MSYLSESAIQAKVDCTFKGDIIDRFRKEGVGEICRSDLVTILSGKKQWAKSVKKDRNLTMSEMRVFGTLILAFRQESGNKTASGLDILNYRHFDTLESVIRKICATDDGQGEAGLKVRHSSSCLI